MTLIDWHTHAWLPEHLGDEWGPEFDARYGRKLSLAAAPERHAQRMRESGVDHAVVIALTSRRLRMEIPNEFVAEYVAADPGRLTGFACVDPSDPGAVDALRHAAKLGLKGLKLAPPYQGFHPHADEAMAVYRAAADLGMVLMFHQGGVFVRRGVLEVAQGVLLDRVAREFPELPLIVAHFGQPWAHEVVALMYKHDHVYADISARLHRPSQLHGILLNAIDYGVHDRVLFGSDFPALEPDDCVKAFRAINDAGGDSLRTIDEAVIEDIMFDRPLSLVGL